MADSHYDSRWPTSHALFPLSKIHRLLRPLRTSLFSLQHAIQLSSSRHRSEQSLLKKHHRYFTEQKSLKRRAAEDVDFFPAPKRKYKPTKRSSLPASNNYKRRPTNPVSSPIFSSPIPRSLPRPGSVLHKLNQRASTSAIGQEEDPNWLDMQTKIDKLVLAYRNILEAVCADDDRPPRRLSDQSSTGSLAPAAQVDRLTTICARVIGRSIELAVHEAGSEEGSADEGEQQPGWLANEPDWKTSVMDEWYDAIPLLYRRHTLAQHALSLILLSFPPTASSSELAYHLRLFHALHLLHRTYVSRLIQPQAQLLLPYLFALPSTVWFELYDDYRHKFGLLDAFVGHFVNTVHGRPFVEYWCDWHSGLAGFVDLAVDRFGALAVEAWVAERERLVALRARWQRAADARTAGLESSDGDGAHEGMVAEYDRRTVGTVVRWLDALVAACAPTALSCGAARGELNAISRALFDCLAAAADCPSADNFLLSVLAITVEAHRLALFGLAMFNTGPLDLPGCAPEWASPHTPMRLQKLLPARADALGRKMLAKAAKLFFRAHRHTRLLAILPGPGPGAPIPGLDALLRTVVEGEYALEAVAKSWVESLLLTDPASWWTRPAEAEADEASEEEESRARGAQDVRSWLEDWLGVLDDAERLRAADSDSDECADAQDDSLTLPLPKPLPAASPTGTAEDAKPEPGCPLVCTCPGHGDGQAQVEAEGEEDDKPLVEPEPEPQPRRASQHTSSVRVVVPRPAARTSRVKKRRLTPPSTRAQVRRAMMERASGEGLPCAGAGGSGVGIASGSGLRVSMTRTGVVAGVGRSTEWEQERESSGNEAEREKQGLSSEDEEDDEFDAMDLLRRPTPSVGGSTGSRFVTPVARASGCGVGGVSGGGGGSGVRPSGSGVGPSGSGVGHAGGSGGGHVGGSGSGVGTSNSGWKKWAAKIRKRKT